MEQSIDWAKLAEPFPEKDIEWRVQASGNSNGRIWARVLAYITNRAIQERLDSVVGVENWRNEYQKAPDGGVMCGLSIRINGEWVTKWDGAGNTDVEGVKGGLSNAMKRAGVQWGIGRYLYDLEADYAIISANGSRYAQLKDKTPFHWDPPKLPDWALPKGTKPSSAPHSALKPAEPPVTPPPTIDYKADIVKVFNSIGEILKATDEKLLPYFNDDEVKEARTALQGIKYDSEGSIAVVKIKEQYERMLAQKKELDGVPFEDGRTA